MYEADPNDLATMTRIPRAVLLREAVDDLLEKHRVIWSRSRQHGVPSCGTHWVTLKSGELR
jgi:Ribbon-helix-helix domain